MRKDILEKVNRFYKERLAFYEKLKDNAIAKANEDKDILALSSRINEIKLLALQGKSTKETDAEYDRLEKEYDDKIALFLPKIQYECPVCHDTGVINGKYCKCFQNRYVKELKENAGIGSLPHFTFEMNKLDSYDLQDDNAKRYAKVYSKLEGYADNYPDVEKRNIFLRGQAGCGKTCLVSAIANRLIERSISVQYITAFDLGELMLESHLNYKDNSLGIVTNADVLIIDDLGSEPIRNNINVTYLQSILDSRITHEKATIVTTNYTVQQLMSKYGERVISRLLNKSNTEAIDFGTLPNLRTIKKK